MPVIGIQTDLLTSRLGVELSRDELAERLTHLGCDVEGYATLTRLTCERCGNIVEITGTQEPPVVCDRCGVDFREHPELRRELGQVEVIRMELLAVRPDMFDPGGLARVLRAYLGHEAEPPRYELAEPRLRVEVDPAMLGPACPRPAIACAVVRGIHLDDDLIKVVMKLQESLHWALGRDRKHASIGVYDLDTLSVDGPLRYMAVEPEGVEFVPLGYDPDAAGSAMTPRRILEEHPKGVAFARLLKGWERYPLLVDAKGRVLSMPPIINSEATRVHHGTTSFFIDVTGTGERIVNKALNVLVTSLAELDPRVTIERVEVAYPERVATTPDLTPQEVPLDPEATARLIGVDLTRERVVTLLGRMGHRVQDQGAGPLTVLVPAYRNDIMHPRDLMEDVAIAYGYHNIVPTLVPTFTVSSARPVEEGSGLAREAMTGLGYQEVMTLQLTCEEVAFDALRLERRDDYVAIENPISVEETMLRVSLIPGLLHTLQVNTHRELPQRIFETGDVTFLDPDAETGAREHRRMAAALTASTAGYEDLRPVAEALLAELGWTMATVAHESPTYLPGRAAMVLASKDGEPREVGVIGEVHPAVLENFKLRHPTVVFELDLEALLGLHG